MPLVKALELAVNQYAIFDVDSFVAVLRSPHFSSQLADLIDSRRALIEATASTANAEVQADIVDAADADVEPVVEVAVAETMGLQRHSKLETSVWHARWLHGTQLKSAP